MDNSLSNLINDLKGLGKKFETIKLIKKIFQSLLKSWNIKVTTIEESKYLSKIGINELIRSFLTYDEEKAPGRGKQTKK